MKNVKELKNKSVVIFRDLSLKHGICRINKNKKAVIISDGIQYDLINIAVIDIK